MKEKVWVVNEAGVEGSNFILDMFATNLIMMTYCRFAKLMKKIF
jgi:hypothetical protein